MTLDPEGRVGPAFEEVPEMTLGATLLRIASFMAMTMALRLVHLYCRRWLSRSSEDDRRSRRRRRKR